MKIVKEGLQFNRDKDPKKGMDIGREGSYSRRKTYERLISEGIEFWGMDRNQEEKYQMELLFLQYIYDIEKMTNRLKELGIKILGVSATFNRITIYINTFQILRGNTVILDCLNRESAEILIKSIEKLSPSYSEDDIYIQENGDVGISLKQRNFIDNIEKNIEVFKKILQNVG